MSERQERFEIDLDEIERRLKRSTESGPPSKADPLAELARIVGQDDPFGRILGMSSPAGVSPPRAVGSASTEPSPSAASTNVGSGEPEYDPYAVTADAGEENYRPLTPRRSRRRLAAVLVLLGGAAVGTAGALAWRNLGGRLTTDGEPPIIQAERAPLKVAPENPGGMDIPDQNKQIYEREAESTRTRMVDRQEQPVDVREAARTMQPPPAAPSPVIANSPPAASAAPGPSPTVGDERTPPTRTVTVNALGEPRRVRTVAVRPESLAPAPSAAELAQSIIPSASLPPPVPVATIPILNTSGQNGAGSTARPGVTVPPVPSVPPATVPSAPASGTIPIASGTTAPVTVPAVLPPARPRIDGRNATVTAQSGAALPSAPNASDDPPPLEPESAIQVTPPRRVTAVASPPATVPDASVTASAAVPSTSPSSSGRANFSVQLSSRPTEGEARAAYDELSARYASELGGKPVVYEQAEANGRSTYRIRVRGMTKDEATNLCSTMKTSGQPCFVSSR